jgi:hypothetical protein
MALAKYFSKDALAISQLLQKGSIDLFEEILNKHVIEIAFDNNIFTSEGLASLDLSIKLISRLYPKIKITDLTGINGKLVEELTAQSKRINSNIEITKENATVKLVLGKTKVLPDNDALIFYIGSDRWLVKFSDERPVGNGTSNLPFAAGFTACIGAANIFRFVFEELIDQKDFDKEISFSLLDLSFKEEEDKSVMLENWGDVSLVGLGAIGNGIMWAFSKLNNIKGNLTVIDHQQVSLSNLQRYILTEESDEGRDKIELAKNKVGSETFIVNCYRETWQTYIKKTRCYRNSVVLTALDSANDRIAVQSSLPNHIFNGFTEQGLLGVSRHVAFLKKACLNCVYLPHGKKKNYSEEVAENLRIPQHEKQIRGRLYDNSLTDAKLMALIAEANQINLQDLNQYLGLPMSEFYTNFVCGGVLLSLKKNSEQNVRLEAPLAFQSALAGILLTSEFFLWKAGHRDENFPVMTHIYPLISFQPKINPYNHELSKDTSTRCICADEDYKRKYSEKWLTNA